MTRCEQQDSLLQEQREKIRSLEADRDEVSPVGPNGVERMSAVNGYTWSLGGYGNPGISCGNTNPRCDCPGVCGKVYERYERVEMCQKVCRMRVSCRA